MPTHSQILPPRSLAQIIGWISELTEPAFLYLVEILERPEGFDLEESAIIDLSKESGLSTESVGILVSALSYLNDRIEKINPDRKLGRDDVLSLLKDLAFDDKDISEILVRRLPSFFNRNEKHNFYKKVRRLEAGFLPNAIEFSSFVDVRPIINSTRDKIDGFTIVVQLNIETDSTKDHESDYTIQFTPKSLGKLKMTLEDIQRKLDTLRAEQSIASRLWETT